MGYFGEGGNDRLGCVRTNTDYYRNLSSVTHVTHDTHVTHVTHDTHDTHVTHDIVHYRHMIYLFLRSMLYCNLSRSGKRLTRVVILAVQGVYRTLDAPGSTTFQSFHVTGDGVMGFGFMK